MKKLGGPKWASAPTLCTSAYPQVRGELFQVNFLNETEHNFSQQHLPSVPGRNDRFWKSEPNKVSVDLLEMPGSADGGCFGYTTTAASFRGTNTIVKKVVRKFQYRNRQCLLRPSASWYCLYPPHPCKFLNKSTWIKTMRLCFVSCQVAKLIIMVQELPQERMQTALQEQTGKEYVIPNLDEDDGGGTLSSWTRYNSLIRQGTALIAIVIVIIIIFELKKVVVSCKNILHNVISLDKVA